MILLPFKKVSSVPRKSFTLHSLVYLVYLDGISQKMSRLNFTPKMADIAPVDFSINFLFTLKKHTSIRSQCCKHCEFGQFCATEMKFLTFLARGASISRRFYIFYQHESFTCRNIFKTLWWLPINFELDPKFLAINSNWLWFLWLFSVKSIVFSCLHF